MAVDFSNITPEQQQQFLIEQGRLREQIETEAKRQEAMRKVLQIARQRGYLDPRDVDNFGLDYDEVNSLFRAGQIKPISTPVSSQPPVYDGFGGIKARREAMESSSPVEPKQTSGSTVTPTGRSTGSRVSSSSYATSGQPTGGTYSTPKPIPMNNPNNVSLAYSLSNTPISPEMQRQALIDKWNLEHGRTGSTGYATGKGMLTSSSNGSYSSQEGMQSPMPVSDNWKFREAWKDPMAIIGQFGRGAFTDDEYNQLVNHAVNDFGYNKNVFSGGRFR